MNHSIFGMLNKTKWYLIALYAVNWIIFQGAIEDMGVFIDTPSILFVLVVSAIYASIGAKDRSNFLPNFCSAALVAGLIGTIIGLIGIPDAFKAPDYAFDPISVIYAILVALISLFWGLTFWLNGRMLQAIVIRLNQREF